MAEECNQTIEIVRWSISVGAPVLSGLAGIFIGAWLSGRQAKAQRKHSFIEKQLSHFYSPMLGLRSEIRMRSELRVKIQDTANSAWKELCEDARQRGGPEETRKLSDDRFREFKGIIEYDNRMLTEELIPAYKTMVKIFRENMWLAEPSTREYFRKLLEFVDMWDRWLDKSMPVEVLEKLRHTEETLHPFYEHLEQTHSSLRKKLETGEA